MNPRVKFETKSWTATVEVDPDRFVKIEIGSLFDVDWKIDNGMVTADLGMYEAEAMPLALRLLAGAIEETMFAAEDGQ